MKDAIVVGHRRECWLAIQHEKAEVHWMVVKKQ